MSIENELVKFIAEIELDPETSAKFTQSLRDANQSCSDLRKEITKTSNQLAVLKAKGEENSDEYQKLVGILKEKRNALKENIKEVDKYTGVLGINKMSLNQLRQHAKQLRTALNSMSKEANPTLWKQYNKELIQTEDRMKEVQIGAAGIQEPLLSARKIFENFKTVPGIIGLVSTGVALLRSGVQKIAEQTQVWGDKWQMTVTKVQAGWNQFIANLGQGKDVIKASVNDAVKAAADAQLLVDELFERENSTSILTVKLKTEINELMGIVKDVSKSDEERYAALEKVFEKEAEIANMKKNVAQQDLDAKTLALSTRTGLTGRPLEIMVDEYEKYRDLINISAEYDTELQELTAAEQLYNRYRGTSLGALYEQQIQLHQQNLNSIKSKFEETRKILEKEQKIVIDGSIDTWKGWYKQYNLSNDELIKGYVEAKVAILQIDNDLAQHNAKLAGRRGELKNQMNAEAKEFREREYSDAIDQAELSHRTELNSLKQQLLNKEISQEEYNTRSAELERIRLETLKTLNLKYGKDISVIDGMILDERLKNQTPEQKNRPAPIAAVSGSPLTNKATSKSDPGIAKTFDMEMTALNILHEAKAISEEEFLKRRNELYEKYGIEQQEQEQTLWDQGMESKLQATQKMLDAMGNAVSSAKDAELATIEAQMQAELAAAGDNAEKREQIEAKYEAKKLDVQKKYADIDMGIQIAQATAAGALAMVQAWNGAKGNPVLAGVIMALIGATTATQIATIIAQRNAIKNASSGGTSGGTEGTTQARVVTGFSEGGYTGDGARLEVAGVVHKGEYVVPQPELRDPYVASMVATIESRRRRRTSANALPGFAEGGYTGPVSGSRYTEDLLYQILGAIKSNNENPTPAYVVLSEINAKQETMNRFKQRTSLRRK